MTNSQSVNNCFFLTGEAMSVKRFDFVLDAEKFVRACPISKFPSVLPVLFYESTNPGVQVCMGKAIMGGALLFSEPALPLDQRSRFPQYRHVQGPSKI